jgi:hypothetical protein
VTSDEYKAERLASALDQHLRDGIAYADSVQINGVAYEPVPDPATGDDSEIILRGPDGQLYDIELEVTVTDHEARPA